jgi:hypothetical protein
MKNHIKAIMESAKRSYDYDNRNFQTKAINNCIENGMVKITVADKDRLSTNSKLLNKDGSLWGFNLRVDAFGFASRVRVRHSIEPNDILIAVGNLLNKENIKEKINASYFESCDCSRCNGKGIIPQFHYYCSGICFDCYGSGKDVKKISI